MPTSRTHYEELGLAGTASSDDIKKAYRQLARQLHPDVLASQGISHTEHHAKAERFKLVTHAHDVLSDPQRKAAYDLSLVLVPSFQTRPSAQPSRPHEGFIFFAEDETYPNQRAYERAEEVLRMQEAQQKRVEKVIFRLMVQNPVIKAVETAKLRAYFWTIRVLTYGNWLVMSLAVLWLVLSKVVGSLDTLLPALLSVLGPLLLTSLAGTFLGVMVSCIVALPVLYMGAAATLELSKSPYTRGVFSGLIRRYFKSALLAGAVVAPVLTIVQF